MTFDVFISKPFSWHPQNDAQSIRHSIKQKNYRKKSVAQIKRDSFVMFSVAPVQQRFSHDHFVSQKEIGPPASFNQLPHPEGDWTENHQKKQTKYNAILAGAAVFFAATFGFVSIHTQNSNSIQPKRNRISSQLTYCVFFLVFFPCPVETIGYYLLQCLRTRYLRINAWIDTH